MNTKYNIDKNDDVCCLCECMAGVHLLFWSCPIFDDELICSDCCHINSLKLDSNKKFSDKLGKEISKEELEKYCKDCGRHS